MQMSLAASIFLSIMLFSLPGCGDRSGQKTGDQAMHLPEADSILLARYPDSVGLRLEVSAASEAGGDVRRALQWVDEGLQRDSLQPVLWNRKASLLLSMQDTTGAIGSLLRSLSVDPSQTDILLELGFIYADRRDPAALSVAERILSPAGDPRFQAQAQYLKGIYFGNIGRFAEAIRAYDGAIGSSYTFTDAYIEKGILLYEQKRVTEALSVFEKVLTVNNALADAYYWRGRCLETGGDKTAALDDYRRALSLDPDIRGAREGEKRLSK
ncbi:MAG: tetratricopeptide repeat protein [Chitinophagaceae bacterium]